MATNFDRTVHGYTADGDPIVRYDRAGKWYVEPKDDKRRLINLTQAAELAIAGKVLENRYGGQMFNTRVKKLRAVSCDDILAAPIECREAYAGSLEYGQVIECAKSGRHWKHQNAAGDLAWYGGKLSAEEHVEADRIRGLGGFDRAKARAYADKLRTWTAADAG